ncbi:MAG TPA: hypothetical protein VMZ50_03865 [Phycisphaerae bacterium]|nr:hypothetical protein [Phycisphaerae bacterium]
MKRRITNLAIMALCIVAALVGVTALVTWAASSDANATIHTRVAVVDADGTRCTPRLERGVATPQTAVTVNEAWETAVAIPAGTCAIRVYSDQLVYCVPNATSANPSAGGAPITPGTHHEIGCAGCTYLHLGKHTNNAAVAWTAVAADTE